MKPNDDKKSIVSNYLTLHHCAVKLHELPSPPPALVSCHHSYMKKRVPIKKFLI